MSITAVPEDRRTHDAGGTLVRESGGVKNSIILAKLDPDNAARPGDLRGQAE
jgi:hypothetical protein